ncbi:MAG: undecaprenyldiphospho-muramoylpentapeptide beta-N-acetylglucosaminyltransferase [bacterium]|nr:undecaprenyldiphospho-muramoylpentapeptide beta-N-acetylglucosaminyltransferase [bacterium]
MTTARLIFAGGGTGGHLYPAIAIADRMKEMLSSKMPVEIIFVGTKRGIEYRVRETLGYPLHLINIRGIARSFTFSNLAVPFLIVSAMFKANALVKKFAPHVVVGTGGYVSWPVLRAASGQKITTVLQEQNSFPGVTTRQLAPKATRIYLGFGKASEMLKTSGEMIVTGNPVRANISKGDRAEAMKAFGLDPNKKTILVIGGSQGARSVNQAVLQGLQKSVLPDGYQLLWQTGKRDYTEVSAAAGAKAKSHALFPFESRMELVYAAADVAIARAGAITLAEIEACAIPSVLIPYPHAAGDHQRKNAEEFARQGYATVIDENELAGHDPLSEAVALISSGKAAQMRTAMRQANEKRSPAVDIIANDIVNLVTMAMQPGAVSDHRAIDNKGR